MNLPNLYSVVYMGIKVVLPKKLGTSTIAIDDPVSIINSFFPVSKSRENTTSM